MKKKSIKILTIILVMVMMMPYFGFAEEIIFKDISDSYVKTEIEALYKDGILEGMGQGLFNPKGKMNRAQLSAVLVRSLNLQEDKENAKNFQDVPQNSWYAGYVGSLAKTGITEGTSKTTFSPSKNVTKQELAAFYIRALGLEEKAKELKIEPDFSDKDKVALWAKDYVGLAFHLELITGTKNKDNTFKFDPTMEVDRELLASATYKLNYNKELYSNILSPDKDAEKPVDPNPVDPNPAEPKDHEPVKPVEPTEPVKPTEPSKPEQPVKPVEPPKPAVDDKNENIQVQNVIGKKVEFMGAYLISIEFDIIGNLGSEKIELIINDGTKNEMKLNEGTPKSYDFYFDGMVLSIDTITLYIANKKIDLMSTISWK